MTEPSVTSLLPPTRAGALRRVRLAATMAAMILAATSGLAAAADMAMPDQPANVGDAKIAATAYYKSGAYDRDLGLVADNLDDWIATRAPQVAKPALVLDIDDTALTNWEVIVADDFGRVFDGPCDVLPKGPCGWVAWDLASRSPAITTTLDAYKKARALNVAVFFITGRDESQRQATIKNLQDTGYGDYQGLAMTPIGAHFTTAADFKMPQREAIEKQGYTIIANMGDQPSDLAGGHAEKTFLLPNPFYRIP